MSIEPLAIQICNQALDLVGADPINSFVDETREARLCASSYDPTKNALLEVGWSFASGQAQLMLLNDVAPLYGFSKVYQLPSDFLSLDETEELDAAGYRQHSRFIYTNMAPLLITYNFKPDETVFSEGFKQYLMYALAEKFAIALPKDEALADAMRRSKKDAYEMAYNADQRSKSHSSLRQEAFAITQARFKGIGTRRGRY